MNNEIAMTPSHAHATNRRPTGLRTCCLRYLQMSRSLKPCRISILLGRCRRWRGSCDLCRWICRFWSCLGRCCRLGIRFLRCLPKLPLGLNSFTFAVVPSSSISRVSDSFHVPALIQLGQVYCFFDPSCSSMDYTLDLHFQPTCYLHS